jgi:hypothetical protein
MRNNPQRRFNHWMNPNAGNQRPTDIVFFDCESYIDKSDPDTQRHTFRLAWAAWCSYTPSRGLVERAWKEAMTPGDLWRWIAGVPARGDKVLVMSHNLDYDVRVSHALTFLPKLGFNPAYGIISESCTFFQFEAQDLTLSMMDNLSLWPSPLADIGQVVGCPKGHVDFDTVTDDSLSSYCKNDVLIMVRQWQFWLRFLDENNLGNFSITLPKQAFNAYRHRFMPSGIAVHNNEIALELERAAYRGGRAEAFYVGRLPKGLYYKLDANSLYPAVMKEHTYPTKLVKVIYHPSLHQLSTLLELYMIIAEVVLDTTEPVFVTRVDAKNAYPTGTFVTTLTTPEVQYAFDKGFIRGVGRVALYERGDIFSKYVDYFYALKERYSRAGQKALAKMAKLMMNALQGKFGQAGHAQKILGDAPPDEIGVKRWIDLESDNHCVDLTFGGKVIRSISGGEAPSSFPAIPAHVTAYARLRMWQLIQKAGLEHVYYIDTDSLIVDDRGYKRLYDEVDPFRLGALKLESTSEHVSIFARKDYVFAGKHVQKGIRKDAEVIGKDKYTQFNFTTLKWAMKHKALDDVRLQRMTKTVRYMTVQGKVRNDHRITPPHLTMTKYDVIGLAMRDRTTTTWTWEFDPLWMEQVIGVEPFPVRV